MEATIDVNAALRMDLAREILDTNIDFDIIKKLSEYLKKLTAKTEEQPDYYESEQFHKDLEESREQIRRGEYVDINSEEDLDKLVFGNVHAEVFE